MALILFIPLIVSIICFLLPTKWVNDFALAFSTTFFAYIIYLLFTDFNPQNDFHYTFQNLGIRSLGAQFTFGLDGLGMLMVALTNFVVMYVNIMATKKGYSSRFYGLVFLMQFALIGVFSCLSAFFFYVFWELALIPIYLILLFWGTGKNRKETFITFFVYTFVGSLLILGGFIFFHIEAKMGDYDGFQYLNMVTRNLEGYNALIFSTLMIIGFGVKIPIFPLHSWQAQTYKKAPIEGTILLSAIMLKMGIYGIFRWVLPFLDLKHTIVQEITIILSVIGVLYGAIIALRRNDLKLIAAFSSLSHVGLITAGLLTANIYGMQGAVIQMVVHGINVLGLFYIIDIIQKQTGTRNIQNLGGIASKAPIFSILSLIIILGTISVPLTNGFPGEMLLLFSLYLYKPVLAVIAGLTIIFGAAYMLRIYQLTFFREVSVETEDFKEISISQMFALGFIAFLVIAIGLFPQYILDISYITCTHLKNLLATRI
jgi:NADH-quinone oxidoreductase subunit M